jgi:hypothetical protein
MMRKSAKRIKDFFVESYKNNPKAFYIEVSEALATMSASLIMSLTVLNPATHIFIPLFLVGGILGTASCYLRKSSAIVLTGWFTIVNVWAVVQLFIL